MLQGLFFTKQEVKGRNDDEKKKDVVKANEPYVEINFVVNEMAHLFDDFANALLCRCILQELIYPFHFIML
jgi:hypothetical protein